MYKHLKLIFVFLITLSVATVNAQGNSAREKEELQMIALEALIHMPEEQALPKVLTLLEGDSSDELKESALFVLSQMDSPEAAAALLDFAKNGSGRAQEEAITMIGISGDATALAALPEIYAAGDEEVRESVLEAYLIADDVEGVFTIAMNATDEDEYEEAVEILAVMEAHDKLAQLREAKGTSEALVDAFMISENYEELEKLARDGSDPDIQEEAIQAENDRWLKEMPIGLIFQMGVAISLLVGGIALTGEMMFHLTARTLDGQIGITALGQHEHLLRAGRCGNADQGDYMLQGRYPVSVWLHS